MISPPDQIPETGNWPELKLMENLSIKCPSDNEQPSENALQALFFVLHLVTKTEAKALVDMFFEYARKPTGYMTRGQFKRFIFGTFDIFDTFVCERSEWSVSFHFQNAGCSENHPFESPSIPQSIDQSSDTSD
jgi:hypothetical protein